MELSEIRNLLEGYSEKINGFHDSLDLDRLEEEIALLDNDMVDTIIIQIAPVLLGKGIPLFSQKEVLKRFYLNEVKKYGQFAELIYGKI